MPLTNSLSVAPPLAGVILVAQYDNTFPQPLWNEKKHVLSHKFSYTIPLKLGDKITLENEAEGAKNEDHKSHIYNQPSSLLPFLGHSTLWNNDKLF